MSDDYKGMELKERYGDLYEFVTSRYIDVDKTSFRGNPVYESLGLLYICSFHEDCGTFLSGISISKIDQLNFSNYSVSWKCGSKRGKKGTIKYPLNFFERLNISSDIKDEKGNKDNDRLETDIAFKRKRFIAIYLDIQKCPSFKLEDHANALLYDRQSKIMERFEPHGSKMNYYDYKMFDDEFEKELNKHNIKYKRPIDYIPEIGIQKIQEKQRKEKKLVKLKTDPGGFCSVWCLFYIDLVMTFPDVDRYKMLSDINKLFSELKIDLTSYIRGYSEYISKAGRSIYDQRR